VLAALAIVAAAPAAHLNRAESVTPLHKCPKTKRHVIRNGKHSCVAKPKPKPKPPVSVQLLAINDFHGNLQPPSGSSARVVTPTGNVDAGGVEYLATRIKELRTAHANTITVGAGDLIGASPLLSGLFHDEPTIEAMNSLGLDISAVGNHEFDEGVPELLRMQHGGCHPVDGCQDGDPFGGALFRYLAANVITEPASGRTLFPPYEVKTVGGAKVGFIGLTLQDTPTIVTPAGVAGLFFRDEADAINAYANQLTQQGVKTIVVLIHEGGRQAGANATFDSCADLQGPIVDIVNKLNSDVDVVLSAHTHEAYNCTINNKIVTSAASFGRLVTQVTLTISATTGDVTAKTAHNVIVTRDVAKDAAETGIVDKYNRVAAPIANRVVGSITADITRAGNTAGESALGDVIADAQLEATSPTDFGGALVAFQNPGGIRADLVFNNSTGGEAPGQVTYSELFSVQPFANVLTVKTCTGDQIKRLLEQQFDNPSAGADRVLAISAGFTYSYDRSRPAGSRVDASSIKINGQTVSPGAQYRVTMNNFLASGGDNFTVFNECTNPLGGDVDIDALVRYFQKHSPVPPGPRNRITRTG
jgi:5'-nucleotidase